MVTPFFVPPPSVATIWEAAEPPLLWGFRQCDRSARLQNCNASAETLVCAAVRTAPNALSEARASFSLMRREPVD
ncbi:MAG: hypothetical protein JWN34_4639 [Bryobacterales bacterium]|nr:hypothetical protein [Bryobacterales bacterium]